MSLQRCCLLIGNSRWHWAIEQKGTWDFIDTAPNADTLKKQNLELWKWGSVGPSPKTIQLEPTKRINVTDVPLINLPDWIGIDRALTAWEAFQQAKSLNLHTKGILIADAGTVLSLTRITANGEFAGGQLIAGLQLQLKAMSSGTENLTKVEESFIPHNSFPISTKEAMLRGSFEALLGAILNAQRKTNMPIWLCGGDSKMLFEHLQKYQINLYLHPNLGLEAMIKIHI